MNSVWDYYRKKFGRKKFGWSKQKSIPTIVVKDPYTHDTWESGKYTDYLICIRTAHPAFHLPVSAVRRRYSEIRWLYKTLKSHNKNVSVPPPPPRHIWSNRFSQSFIETRRKAIEDYLNELLRVDTILSDTVIHMFLQTDLTTKEIDDYLTGKISEVEIEDVWKNSGRVHKGSLCISPETVTDEPVEITMNEDDIPASPIPDTSSQCSEDRTHTINIENRLSAGYVTASSASLSSSSSSSNHIFDDTRSSETEQWLQKPISEHSNHGTRPKYQNKNSGNPRNGHSLHGTGPGNSSTLSANGTSSVGHVGNSSTAESQSKKNLVV